MIQVKSVVQKEDDDIVKCKVCYRQIEEGESYLVWGIRFDREFIQCINHPNPTKLDIALSILKSYGYGEQYITNNHYRINQVREAWTDVKKKNGRVERVRYTQILNPATPSFVSVSDLMFLYENPTYEVLQKLLEQKRHTVRYMEDYAREELARDAERVETSERRYLVISEERRCQNCGVLEKTMLEKNSRYYLCKGYCRPCYNKIVRGARREEQKNVEEKGR